MSRGAVLFPHHFINIKRTDIVFRVAAEESPREAFLQTVGTLRKFRAVFGTQASHARRSLMPTGFGVHLARGPERWTRSPWLRLGLAPQDS